MALNFTGARVLSECHYLCGDFQKTAVCGRQKLAGRDAQLVNSFFGNTSYSGYIEQLLTEQYGSTEVDSIDINAFEGANVLLDLSEPITDRKLLLRYDTVIDLGTSEHVYNVAQGFKNISLLCKSGGRIIHVLPANNWVNHGFWQISPELYSRLYSKENGYERTTVYFSDRSNTFFDMIENNKLRSTTDRTFASCFTVKPADHFEHSKIYQSSYVESWNK